MGDKNDFVKGPPSIISEIEGQLDEILSKKKESVEKALEEKIRREEEEAKRRMQEIEQEMAAEKEALLSYRNILSEFEEEKVKIKKQIQKHLEKASKIQAEIENKTFLTLEELNKVTELNNQLEGINKETEQKVVSLKEDLEQKYGISPMIPEYRGDDHLVQIGSELDKLNKIKELLEANGNIEAGEAAAEVELDAEQELEVERLRDNEIEMAAPQDQEESEVVTEEKAEEAVEEPESQAQEQVVEEMNETEAELEPVKEAIQEEEEKVEEEDIQTVIEEQQEDVIEEEAVTETQAETEAEAAADAGMKDAIDTDADTDSKADQESEEEEVDVKETKDKAEDEIAGEETESQTEAEAAPETEEAPEEEGEFEAEIIRLDADEEESEEISSTPESSSHEESKNNGNDIELSLMNTLDKYRKSEGTKNEDEVSFFENQDRLTLDGDYIIATMHNNVNEAKKLYIQLSQTKSPKEQFFIKQEIIRHQESIRKLMLNILRISEKDSFFLPYYTQDILNVEVFKIILEKVSMENWSNQEDFNSFDEYDSKLKDAFYERITPPTEYLNSIIKELKITA